MLEGKRVLLGVTGGIAAYKTPLIVRLLIKAGAEVRVIATPAAFEFVTPLTLSTLTGHPVISSYTDQSDVHAVWNNHVEIALWADLILFAPLTANTLAKMVQGQSDNLLMGVYMSAKSPIYVAPAMDLDMYKNPATQHNLSELQARGIQVIPAEHGFLASGLEGQGRMAEPEHIVQFIENHILSGLPLRGKRVLITMGPTREAIDPVRFISNRSSGKMGSALVDEAISRGAEVQVISGPVTAYPNLKPKEWVSVESAREMFNETDSRFSEADIAIFTAAVSDYRPANPSEEKMKKSGEHSLTLELVQNPDILAHCGAKKTPGQLVVGFALETQDELAHAQQKREKKQADIIVLNSLREAGAGFEHDTNAVYLISADTKPLRLELKEKTQLASEIWDFITAQKRDA